MSMRNNKAVKEPADGTQLVISQVGTRNKSCLAIKHFSASTS